MRHQSRKQNRAIIRHILGIASVWLGVAITLFALPLVPAFASPITILQTTVADFNTGLFYHAGLTRDTSGGGDGNGEVRLLTVGISPNTWNPGGTANATGLPALQGHAAAQKNGYIYVSGGQTTGGSRLANVYYTQINATTHNLGNWAATSTLPGSRIYHAMVAANNYLYVIGGLDSTLAPTNTVLVAPIQPTGSLGPWTSATSIPAPLSDFASVVVSDTIYVTGGVSNTTQSAVYYAKPVPSTGAISAWDTTSAPLPNPTSRHASVVYSATIYVAGGADFGASQWYPEVYYAFPTTTGNITAFTSTIPMPTNLVYGSGAAFGGQLYIAGGAFNQGGSLTNTIASNLINLDGTLLSGGWTNSDVLSSPRQRAATVMSNDGWLYVIEGNASTGLDPLNTIDYGPTAAAGATRYAQDGNFISSVIDVGGNYTIQKLDWNATVSSTVSMTLQYRLGTTPDLTGVAWNSEVPATRGGALPVTNTTFITQTARYVQYRINMSSASPYNQSPVLNAVQVTYELPPDLYVAGMDIPPVSQSTRVMTLTVRIGNMAGGGTVQRPVLSGATSPPTQTPSGGRRRSSVSSGTPFFYVEFYINRSRPTSIMELGDCYGSWQPWANPILPGTTVAVYIDHKNDGSIGCPIPGGKNTFYVQVDSCDLPNPPNACSTYGYVFEKDETNNIGGPFESSFNYLFPLILKND